jgi:hypothetical protein
MSSFLEKEFQTFLANNECLDKYYNNLVRRDIFEAAPDNWVSAAFLWGDVPKEELGLWPKIDSLWWQRLREMKEI